MKRLVIGIIGFIIIALAAVIVIAITKKTSDEPAARSLLSANAIATLSKKDESGIDTSHLADDVTPPTNKWFSGIALQAVPKTVFPTPLSFTPTDNSFTFDLPSVQTNEKSILNTPSHPTTVSITDAQQYRITRYDELSVDLTYYGAGDQKLATVTIAAGSPYVHYHGLGDSKITVTSQSKATSTAAVELRTQNDIISTHALAFHNAGFRQNGDTVSGTIPTGGLISFYTLPSSANDTSLRTNAGNRLTGTKVGYEKQGDDYVTTIGLTTDNNQPTVYGLLPHQNNSVDSTFTIDTLYGQQRFIESRSLDFSTPSVPVSDALDTSKINPDNLALLKTQLRHDINATKILAEDTYFGGKEMYRSAQLLQLAKQLNEENTALTIQQKLHAELTTWLKQSDGRVKKVFYYDSKINGIVGQTASFGSQEFNDHHFHYGYFIYAASILAKYDESFKQQYQPMVDMLVADIANYSSDEALPLRRNFDPYFGHSWASGSSPFNDGNNQESASEAINAWVATSLWATQTGNQALKVQSDWMLSNEVQSTMAYWLNYDQTKAPYNQNYSHSISPLNWGGKRDYATFFSAEPSAMLGILLIPMNPSMISYSSLGPRIDTLITEAAITETSQFSDYILMLDSLRGDGTQLSKAQALTDIMIDNANSRSYMYAWIMSQSNN